MKHHWGIMSKLQLELPQLLCHMQDHTLEVCYVTNK